MFYIASEIPNESSLLCGVTRQGIFENLYVLCNQIVMIMTNIMINSSISVEFLMIMIRHKYDLTARMML